MSNMMLERHPMTDKEYLDLLDYAIDMLDEFEASVDAFCLSLRSRASAMVS